MGNSVPRRTSEAIAGKFSDEEIQVLKRTFEDLAARNPSDDHGVDKRTFLRIFQLPGMLGERLFAVFDKKRKEVIDFEDFLVGLSQIVRGTLEEKLKFLFNMYDLNESGSIHKPELTTMLNSEVFAANSLLDEDGELMASDPHNEEPNGKKLEENKQKVEEMIASAFNNFSSDHNKLTLEEFSQWITKYPENLEVIEAVFLRHTINSDDEHDNVPETVIEEPGHIVDPTDGKENLVGVNPIGSSATMGHKNHRRADIQRGTNPRSLSIGRKNDRARSSGAHSADRKKFLDEVFSGTLSSLESPGSRIDLNRSLTTRRKLKPRIYIECHNCGVVLTIFFCYSCGKCLEDDSGNCGQCGSLFTNHPMKFCMTCGFDLQLNEIPLEPNKLRGISANARKSIFNSIPRGTNTLPNLNMEQEHEGYLYRPGNLLTGSKKRWIVLRDNFLYAFKSAKDRKPNAVIFLEGCFVEAVDDEKQNKHPFGVEIIFNEEKNKYKSFFAETAKERDDWLAKLKHAAQVYEFSDYYEMGPEIGTGKFSSVHECTHRVSGKKYAVKVIDKAQLSDKDKESLRTEIAIMQLVNHPNVIQLKNVFENRHHIYIVMGLVKGGDLFDRLTQRKRFDEHTARAIIEKLLKTVQYLHDYGIVHRDLKPENIMVVSPDKDDDVQIADFGLSKFAAPEEVMKLPCGTLAYVAPEVLQMQGYGKEVDLWSIGVILYVLLRGKLPFDGKKKSQIIAKTVSGKIPFEDDAVWEKVSPEAKDLIRHLLQVDPTRRYTVTDSLGHPWFSMKIVKPEPRRSKAKPRRSVFNNTNGSVEYDGDESKQTEAEFDGHHQSQRFSNPEGGQGDLIVPIDKSVQSPSPSASERPNRTLESTNVSVPSPVHKQV